MFPIFHSIVSVSMAYTQSEVISNKSCQESSDRPSSQGMGILGNALLEMPGEGRISRVTTMYQALY